MSVPLTLRVLGRGEVGAYKVQAYSRERGRLEGTSPKVCPLQKSSSKQGIWSSFLWDAAFLLTIGNFVLTVEFVTYNCVWELVFAYNWSFFTYRWSSLLTDEVFCNKSQIAIAACGNRKQLQAQKEESINLTKRAKRDFFLFL